MKRENPKARPSLWAASAVFAAFASLIAFGCGGSSDAPQNLGPTMRASSLSGFQAMGGLSGYVQRAVQASQPAAPASLATDENGYDNMLGLYVGDPVVSANTLRFNFFDDQAHAVPAGHMTLSMSGNQWNPNFAAYPAEVAVSLDVNNGHHAAVGSFAVTLQNASGDGLVVGQFLLEQNNVNVGVDLAVTNGGTQISGGWTAAAQGVTVRVTNLSGAVDGEWSGNVRIDPFGWTGNVVMNPQTGHYASTINSSQGPFTIAVDPAMTMTIHHGSTNIVIPNALAAALNSEPGSGSGSGGNTGGLSSTGSGGTMGGATGGETNGGETNGGETNGGENGGGGTTGETTGETTGTNTTGETTSAGTTGSVTTGTTGSNGSTSAGTTSSGTTGSTTTTGETNGSTSAGTTSSGSTSTTGETNGGGTGSTSSGTTGSTTGETTGGSSSTTGETTGSTTTGTSGSTTGETGSTGSTTGETNSTGSNTTGTSGGPTSGSTGGTSGGG